MSGQEFWIATATDPEGDLHWQDLLVGEMVRQEAEKEFRENCPRLDPRCTLEVFGPFDTAKPLLEPKPEQYDGAVHVFNWARNSEPHYKRMLALKSGQYIRETGRAADASNLAWQTVTEAARSGDIDPHLISSTDILRAASMFLEWDGES